MNSHAYRPLSRTDRALRWSALAVLAALASPVVADPIYDLTPLVTDDQDALADLGFGPAVTVDPNLINPWGMSFLPGGPFWISNQGTNTSTLYTGQGEPFPIGNPLVVDIPQAGPPTGPTGQLFGGGSGLNLPSGNEGLFFFASLDGSISGWNLDSGTTAEVVVAADANRPSVYTGLALASMNGSSFLYAANRVTGAIDVFDSGYQLTTLPAGAFDAGPNPDGLVPFNVQTIGGFIYVTFSIPGVDADEAPLGSGFVNVYNADGSFVRRIDSDQFASPWGVVLAPDDFGEFSNALLIGNFNDEFGFINAFDADTGEFIGTMLNSDGDPLIIPYLWALLFGNGVLSDADDLYFAAGIGDELHGLFGAIDVGASAVSEPGTAALMLLALAGMVGLRGRRGLEPGRAGFVAG
jgi:uncharacterized protein (TIGR03118 family)